MLNSLKLRAFLVSFCPLFIKKTLVKIRLWKTFYSVKKQQMSVFLAIVKSAQKLFKFYA